MTTALSVPIIQTQLAQATTIKETRQVEAVSKVAMAYADEQQDYELYMQAWRVYLDARRKTTGLILSGNMDVTDAGFTKMQWSRRLKEYRIAQEKLDAYFDSIIASGWQPSISGLLRDASGEEIDRFAVAVAELRRGAWKLAGEFRDRTTDYQRKVLASVLDAFQEAE